MTIKITRKRKIAKKYLHSLLIFQAFISSILFIVMVPSHLQLSLFFAGLSILGYTLERWFRLWFRKPYVSRKYVVTVNDETGQFIDDHEQISDMMRTMETH